MDPIQPGGYQSMSDSDLLLQCRVETFRSSGKGGQHVNKTESGVRLKHLPTGITVTCRRERSQYLNKKTCLAHLRERIEERQRPVVERIATRTPSSARKERLGRKKVRAERKRMRRPPELE